MGFEPMTFLVTNPAQYQIGYSAPEKNENLLETIKTLVGFVS